METQRIDKKISQIDRFDDFPYFSQVPASEALLMAKLFMPEIIDFVRRTHFKQNTGFIFETKKIAVCFCDAWTHYN